MKLGPRAKLLLLMALFASPALAAWLAYVWWQPEHFTNYGTLLEPRALDLPPLRDGTGKTVAGAELRGRWVLLVAAPGGCDVSCAHDSYLARQVRLAQGRDQERIERVLVSSVMPENWPYQDGAYRTVLEPWPGVLAGGGLFLLDPRGNLMMRFPAHAAGERVIRDLKLLLRASRKGGA